MSRGGKRAGAGRPKGARNKRTVKMIADASRAGLLPHEFLAAVARGEGFPAALIDPDTGEPVPGAEITVFPTLDQRIACAQAAAPFFASRLASLEVSGSLRLSKDASQYTDDELIAIIELHRGAAPQPAQLARVGGGNAAPEASPFLVESVGQRGKTRAAARKAPRVPRAPPAGG